MEDPCEGWRIGGFLKQKWRSLGTGLQVAAKHDRPETQLAEA